LREPALTTQRLPVSLIGLPGSGKSTVGKELALRLGALFVDCDKVIEQRAGCSIARLFEHDGEPAFRELEAEVLASLVNDGSAVIATGGGAILRPDSRELLRTATTCVYLNASPDLLWSRLRRDRKRPLLQVEDAETRLRELSAQRDPLYREAATIVIDTQGLSFNGLVEAVLERLNTSAMYS